MLEVTHLSVSVDDTQILHNLSGTFSAGQIYGLMGPNGSGKSTFTYALLGHPRYIVTDGTILFERTEMTALPIDERVRRGLFVAFQHPQAVPGVTVIDFLKEAYRACVAHDIDILDLAEKASSALKTVGLNPSFLYRGLHEGFSGGEKKRLEIAQMLLLQPKVAVLDEIDSGLDVDAIKQIARALQQARQENPSLIIIMITHYQRIFKYITPDVVQVLVDGRIAATGDYVLARRIEHEGYALFETKQ